MEELSNLQNQDPVNQLNDAAKLQLEAEKKISANVMSIRLSQDGLVIREDVDPADTSHTNDHLPGVYCQGVMYYDLSNVHYLNNTGMAILIDLLKSLLEMDVTVQFVNVDEKIKARIREMGLDDIINYGQNTKN